MFNKMLPQCPAIPVFGIQPKEMKTLSYKILYMNVHRSLKNLQKKKMETTQMSYLATKRNKVIVYTTMWMNTKNIFLSERSQTERTRYCVVLFTWNRQSQRDRNQSNHCLAVRVMVGKKWKVIAKGMAFLFQKAKIL